MIVVAGVVDDRDRCRARPRRRRRVPDPDRPQRRLPASCRSPLQRGPGPARGVVGGRPRELRGRAAHQGVRSRGTRDRATVDDRRAHPRRADQGRAPTRHVRGNPRGDPVDRQRRARGARGPPCQLRRPHRRTAVGLHLHVHAAGVPVAPDRFRAVRAPALAGRMESHPHRARRADRIGPRACDRRGRTGQRRSSSTT